MNTDASATETSALWAWIDGGQFGLVLIGDPLLRERMWHAIVEETGLHTAPHVGPGTELSTLYGQVDPWTGKQRAGVLDRARSGTLLLPAADLLSPAQASALADAPRILAQAPALTEVPAVLAPRLTVVLDLAHRPGNGAPLRSGVRSTAAPGLYRPQVFTAPRPSPDELDVVELLTRYGLVDHTLDLGATRLARSLGQAGALSVLEAVEHLVCRPRSQVIPPPDESRQPERRPEPESGSGRPETDPESDTGSDGRSGHDEPSEDTGGHSAKRNPSADGDRGVDRSRDQAPGHGAAPEQAPEPPGSLPPPSRDLTRAGRRATRTRLDGKHGAPGDHAVRGRRRRVVPVEASGGIPDVVATLAAALPWQRDRRAPGETKVVVRSEDLRGRKRRLRGGRLLIVVVDASGSMAQNMIRKAKALALGELDRAYRERSTVCIVLARGAEAAVGLPPTRSTNRARDALRALPTGGGTPLASAFLLAARTASRYDPAQVDAIVLTDGRANVGLGGDPKADAVRAAALLSDVCGTVHLDSVMPPGRTDTTGWLRRAFHLGSGEPEWHEPTPVRNVRAFSRSHLSDRRRR